MTEAANSLSRRIAAVALALLPAASLLLLMARPVWDVDVFWQARLGELTLANGGPLATEPFAISHLGAPLPTLAWLGQVALALERQALGWTGLRLIDALCWLGGFWAAGLAARRAGASAPGLLLGLVFGLIAALPAASLRPQSFAALSFGLLILLMGRRGPAWRRLAGAALLLVLWQNLHPSVAIAAVWSGSLAAAGWAAFALSRENSPPWEASALTVLAVLAMVATPDGVSILATSAGNAAISQSMGISEWLPPWAPINRELALPLLLIVVAEAWLLLRTRRLDWREALPALALFVLTLTAYRFVLFWAIAMVPVIARALPGSEAEAVPAPRWLMPLALIVTAAGAVVLLPTRFAPTMPIDQIAGLRQSGVKGTIFAHFPWGGPVIDAGYPDWKVAYDGRYYRYSPEEWALYQRIAREPGGLALAEAAWHPAAFVLDPGWDRVLVAELSRPGSGWRRLSGDDRAVVFVPASQTGQPQRLPAAISNR